MLELLSGDFSLGLVGTSVLIIKMLMLPLILYNLSWSFRGLWQFLRGISFPTSVYQSVIFFTSIGLLGYQLLAIFGRTSSSWSEPYALALQCIFFLSMTCAFIGRRAAITVDFARFYWLFQSNNLDVAVRAAELNQLDPEYAENALHMAETGMAFHLARKNKKVD